MRPTEPSQTSCHSSSLLHWSDSINYQFQRNSISPDPEALLLAIAVPTIIFEHVVIDFALLCVHP